MSKKEYINMPSVAYYSGCWSGEPNRRNKPHKLKIYYDRLTPYVKLNGYTLKLDNFIRI